MLNKNYCLCLIMFTALVGCDNIHGFIQSGPKEVLSDYLDASLKNRIGEAYEYLSSEDKTVKTLSEYKKEKDQAGKQFAAMMIKNVSFEVLKVAESGNKAIARVEITRPDMGVMFKDFMGAAFKSAFGGKENSDLEKELMKKYENEEFPYTTKTEEFRLVKEKEEWKILLDWKGEREVLEKKTKIANLLYDAKRLRKSKKLTGAVQKYEEVLALDSEMVEAENAILETEIEIANIKEKQTYIKKVFLYDLKAKYYESLLDGRLPGVEFKVKNKGNQTLKEIEVTVYFKDAKGTIIAEKEYHPVLASKYSFGRRNKPLKPSYIWQMERGKFYKADSVPSEWKEGKVSAKITNIEFL